MSLPSSLTALLLCFTSSIALSNEGNQSNSLSQLIGDEALVTLLTDGFKFTEGPAADAAGNIYFSDIGNNRIHYWNTRENRLSTIRENSGGADGLYVDRDGALWICELRDKRLTKLKKDGTYEVIVNSYNGEPLTGANDLWIDPHGGIYFSDSYGGSQERTQDHRVFYLTPSGELTLVADNYFKSNGLVGTPDGKWLYVADYIDYRVYRYELLGPGKLGDRTLFAEYRCDGMTLDEEGNLYLCTGNSGQGVVIIDPSGQELGKIKLPENPANICFGGKDYRTLFITATSGFYSLEMKVRGNRNGSPEESTSEFSNRLNDLVKKGAVPVQLATGFRVAQGPATASNGDVYFSDIYHNKIMKWSFEESSLSLVREHPGGPDGLYFEKDGSLLVCELTGLRFGRLHPNGEYNIIADSFEGNCLTGPNDVYVDEEGGIYFSDSFPGSKMREPEYCAYYIAPGSSELKRLFNDHWKTKGLHISLDGKWLYAADYGGRKVYRYELLAPGVLGKRELFIETRCGGMTVDEKGNVYISTVNDSKGVLIYDSEGNFIGQIPCEEMVSSVTFAGPQRNTLIITTLQSIFSLDMKVNGMR